MNADIEEEKRRARPPRVVDAEKARARTLQRAVKLLAAKPPLAAEPVTLVEVTSPVVPAAEPRLPAVQPVVPRVPRTRGPPVV